MQIRLVSSLTHDDEQELAVIVHRMLTTLLDTCPIIYALRIETSDGRVLEQADTPSSIEFGVAPRATGQAFIVH